MNRISHKNTEIAYSLKVSLLSIRLLSETNYELKYVQYVDVNNYNDSYMHALQL